MSTESTGTSSFDDDNVGSTSPSPPKKIKSEEEEEDADDTDIDAVLAAESDCSDSELNDKIVVRDKKLKKGDVAWRLQIASMRTNRHVNNRNVKEEDFTRTEEDFQEKCEILSVKMYVVKLPKVEKTKAALMPVFNKSDFSDSSRIDIKLLRNEKVQLSRIFKYQHNRDINKRILNAVERSVQWAKNLNAEKQKEYAEYLAAITRQEELVRDYFGLPGRDQVDPLDFLVRDNVDRHRKYPQLANKLKASVINFVKKDIAEAGEEAVKDESGEDAEESNSNAGDNSIIELPQGEMDEILSDMTSQQAQHSTGNVDGNVSDGDVLDVPSDDTTAVKEEPLCPERQRQQTMSQKIMEELKRGDYDEYITTIVEGKNKGKRHRHFVKVQHDENPDFHPITSKLGRWCNLGFLSDDEDLDFANITRGKLQEKMDRSELSEKTKADSNLMEKYLTLVLQPELLIKIVLKRMRRADGPRAKLTAAEEFYCKKRVTDLEVARFEEQVDREIMESRSSRSSNASPLPDDEDDESMDGES